MAIAEIRDRFSPNSGLYSGNDVEFLEIGLREGLKFENVRLFAPLIVSYARKISAYTRNDGSFAPEITLMRETIALMRHPANPPLPAAQNEQTKKSSPQLLFYIQPIINASASQNPQT
ncbi:hypothetical protein [Falsibacillus pallidus]|uniref:hypothetical protein n=1 Tax=Falsibacillus pallidus TaxID=493781 RepID=UPI003D972DCA